MRILCAPDKFKGTLTAADAAGAMARGAERVGRVETDCCPVADGGEGTLEALVAALGGRFEHVTVGDPLGRPVRASWAITPDGGTAIVELARASGLALLSADERDPSRTTTYGTGELIAAAMRKGCEEIIVGIGGSATCDGGAGLAQALGARFFDSAGRLIEGPMTGGRLMAIARFEPPPDVPLIRVASDVVNPLCGPEGAAAVYGPQKGATADQVAALERGLSHLAGIVGGEPAQAGAGASGGAGFGLAAMCGATLEPGINLVLEAVGFDVRCRCASLVLTGEGRLDEQSGYGKACSGVARAAARLGIPVTAIVGSRAGAGPGAEFAQVISLEERFGRARAMGEAAALLEQVSEEAVKGLIASR